MDNNNENENNQGLGAPWDEEANDNNIEIEVDDGNDRDANGDLDGGIAVNPDGPSNSSRATADCDLVRIFHYFSVNAFKWLLTTSSVASLPMTGALSRMRRRTTHSPKPSSYPTRSYRIHWNG